MDYAEFNNTYDPNPEPQWAKLSDLKAGDTVELYGFDCAQGVVTIEQDMWGDLFFPCAQGKHVVTGQLDQDGYLVGITIRPAPNLYDQVCIHNLPLNVHCDECMHDSVMANDAQAAKIIPIPPTPERNTMNLDANDANSVSSFFQSLADKVVLASTLPQKVEELSAVVDKLKADVEQYREHMARADEEISNLRRERAALQDENATLRSDSAHLQSQLTTANTRWDQACQERDRWHNDFIMVSEASEVLKRERDDAQMKIMELEDRLSRMATDRDRAQMDYERVASQLNSIRSALA